MQSKGWKWSSPSTWSDVNRTNMKSLSNHHSRRRTIFVAMLVWVFALASGMANACLLETQGKHAHATASHSSGAHHAHVPANAGVAGDALAVEHDDDDADAPKESCLKACDDGSNAQIKLLTGVDLIDPGLVPLIAFAWRAALPVGLARSRFHELRVSVTGPPFRLRYSRLTL